MLLRTGGRILKKLMYVQKIGLFLSGLILVVAFNNCGEGFMTADMNSEGSLGSTGANGFTRLGNESCESALMRIYENSYHPFLTETCGSCHTNGPGLGDFGSKDVSTSFVSFTSIGAKKIDSQSLNENHKPPATGAHNAVRIQELSSYWDSVQPGYLDCVSSSGGKNTKQYIVKTQSKPVPSNLSTTFQKLEWDLESESSNPVPLIATIEIRRSDLNGQTRGYEFRNPTLRLKAQDPDGYAVRALNIIVNDELRPEISTYSNVSKVITETTDLNLAPGAAHGFLGTTISSSDTIGLDFSSIRSPRGDESDSGGSEGGGDDQENSRVYKFSELTAPGGVFATSCFSCHNSSRADGGLNITNYNSAKLAAPNIRSRVNNANNPMPTGGLLPAAQREAINSWIRNGMPQ